MRILLIEDDKNLCELLRFQLEKEHHEVEVCHDGLDGLDLFLQNAHDLVLLDRMLPTMNGLLVLQKARQKGIDTPVILITALGELYDRVEGLDCGADDYLVKPFAFDELLARLRAHRQARGDGRRREPHAGPRQQRLRRSGPPRRIRADHLHLLLERRPRHLLLHDLHQPPHFGGGAAPRGPRRRRAHPLSDAHAGGHFLSERPRHGVLAPPPAASPFPAILSHF